MPESNLRLNDGFLMSAGKGKGCDAKIVLAGSDDVLSAFMGGTGAATFSTPPDQLSSLTLDGVTRSDTLAMEWVTNQFFANHPSLGRINVAMKTDEKSSTRSSIVLLADRVDQLFPATIVNTLFFEMELPRLGIRLFNKQPLLLRSKVVNLDAEFVRGDLRFARDPQGLPGELRALLDGTSPPSFNPVGVHVLKEPVALYDVDHPDRVFGRIIRSHIHSVNHYGLDIELRSSDTADDGVVSSSFAVHNLTDRPQDIVWYLDDTMNIEVLGERYGEASLAPRSSSDREARQALLDVRVRKRAPEQPLTPWDCFFIGASNTPDSLSEFISAFVSVTQIEE